VVKPKRALTGYLLFGKEVRSRVTAQLAREVAEGEKVKPCAVTIAIAAEWKALSKEQNAEWSAKAKALVVVTPVISEEATPATSQEATPEHSDLEDQEEQEDEE
jgi:hypothetical protein